MPHSFSRSVSLFAPAQRSIAGGVNSNLRRFEQPAPLAARAAAAAFREGADAVELNLASLRRDDGANRAFFPGLGRPVYTTCRRAGFMAVYGPRFARLPVVADDRRMARQLALAASPVNGITFCEGCFAEMRVDLGAAIRRLGVRIHFAHCRDVAGSPTGFRETFPDNGPTDLVDVLGAYRDIGYRGFIRSDHVPHVITERGEPDGYGLHGNIFAIGYLKGLMEPLFGKPGAISADSAR